MDWTTPTIAISAAAATATTMYATIIRPRTREHKKREAAIAARREAGNRFLEGVPGDPRLGIPDVEPADVRLHAVENLAGTTATAVHDTRIIVDHLDDQVAAGNAALRALLTERGTPNGATEAAVAQLDEAGARADGVKRARQMGDGH